MHDPIKPAVFVTPKAPVPHKPDLSKRLPEILPWLSRCQSSLLLFVLQTLKDLMRPKCERATSSVLIGRQRLKFCRFGKPLIESEQRLWTPQTRPLYLSIELLVKCSSVNVTDDRGPMKAAHRTTRDFKEGMPSRPASAYSSSTHLSRILF